jgi:hypothetical protein
LIGQLMGDLTRRMMASPPLVLPSTLPPASPSAPPNGVE